MDEIIDIVDSEDTVLRSIFSKEKDRTKDIARCSLVFLYDEEDNMIFQLRSKKDSSYPNCWDSAAGGGLITGESYVEGAHRELFEELGVKAELEFMEKFLYEYDDGAKEFTGIFKGKALDTNFKLNPYEVDSIRSFSESEIRKLMQEEPQSFHPQCLFVLERIFFPKDI